MQLMTYESNNSTGLWALVCNVVLGLGLGLARSVDGQHELCTGNLATVQDGVCDISNNVASCRFDGGACCPSTCFSSAGLCTNDTRQCLDPLARDYPYGEFGDCISISGNLPYIRDGESVLSRGGVSTHHTFVMWWRPPQTNPPDLPSRTINRRLSFLHLSLHFEKSLSTWDAS